MEMVEKEEYIAFDQYQRYRLVSDIMTLFCQQAGVILAEMKVLDLGGVQGFLRAFVPEPVPITTANLNPSERDREAGPNDSYVLLQKGPLPFEDNAFDFGVACDVLEHVPEEEREFFLKEFARVCRRAAILIGPFATEGVKEAEALVAGIYESLFHYPFIWLQEHAQQGLPDLEDTTTQFEKLFRSQVVFSTSFLPHWIMFMAANLVLAKHPRTAALNRQLTDIYAALCHDFDHRKPAYRNVLVGIKEGPELNLSSLLEKSKRPRAVEYGAVTLPNIVAIGALTEQAVELARREEQMKQLRKELRTQVLETQRVERELEQTRKVRSEVDNKLRETISNKNLVEQELHAMKRQPLFRLLARLNSLLGRKAISS